MRNIALSTAGLAASRDRQWDFLCHAFRLPKAPVAEDCAAVEHGLPLVRGLVRCLRVREDQSRAGHARSGAGRARGLPFGPRPIIVEDQIHGAAAPGADCRCKMPNLYVDCAEHRDLILHFTPIAANGLIQTSGGGSEAP